MAFSCTVAKRYQPGKPFIYQVDVDVNGNLKSSEKQDLELRLNNQLDDSLRPQVVSYAGIYKRIVSPPVFDSANVRRSVGFMVALLNSLGYFAPTIKDSVHIKHVHGHHFVFWGKYDESRTFVEFRVNPGKQLKFDSIAYDLGTPALQALALQSRPQSLLQKNEPYSKAIISSELDRLVNIFRNHGYYNFSRSDLLSVQDTVVAALIDPTLDPFQQAALLEDLKRKRDRPTINIAIQQRPVSDSSHIMQYYVGHVTIYPDLPLLEDTAAVNTIDTSTTKGFTIVSRSNKFKPAFVTSNVYLRPGQLYNQYNFTRTLNRFNQLGAWQQAAPTLSPSDSSDSILDVTLRLYPFKKYYLTQDLEASRNTNDIVTATNLFGVDLNLGLRNRNAFRQSVATATNLRGGVELGADFIQTTQVSLSHAIYFPKSIPAFSPSLIRMLKVHKDSIRTVLNMGIAYTDRRQLFTLRSANISWGYEWSKGNKSFLFRPLNIEYTQLDKTDSFQKYLDSIPSLNLAFKSGLVIGMQFAFNSIRKKGIRTDFLAISAEESGALTGLVRSWDEGDLWRFVKADIEYRRHIDFSRTELAMRAYAGAGLAYGREGKGFEQTLPFYKAFFAGGPNSMRAWQVRQLGLGSSKFFNKGPGGKILDRFGDIKLEGNIEYRFPLGTVFGIKLLSALYVDAGNIWDRHATDSTGSDFNIGRFYNEIAVDAGTGLRLNFDYFIIRLDYAYRIRDPQSEYYDNRWFYGLQLFNGQFQLGINYPF
jgi:outer membrane protein insertion porin family